jgi:hypothetical protein
MSIYRGDTRRFTWRLFGGHDKNPHGWSRRMGRFAKRQCRRMERAHTRLEERAYALHATDEIAPPRYRSGYYRTYGDVAWKYW